MVGHHVDQLARDFRRLDARKPHAKVARQLGDLANQVREPNPLTFALASRHVSKLAIPIDAVVAEVNAGEHDFAVAAIHEPADFVEDVLDRPAGEVRPHVRNNAEAAPQHAAVLHFHVRPMPPAEAADAGGNIGHAKAAQQVGQLALVGDDLRHARQRGHFLRRPRGVATHHHDLRAGFLRGQPANRLPALRVALVRHRAGVDNAQLGTRRPRPHLRNRCPTALRARTPSRTG